MHLKLVALWAVLKAHSLACFVAFSVIVSFLPTPGPNSNAAYKKAYYILHFAAANVGKLIVTRWPGAAVLLRMILPPEETPVDPSQAPQQQAKSTSTGG